MRIAKASGEPFDWEIELIESPELNGVCQGQDGGLHGNPQFSRLKGRWRQ